MSITRDLTEVKAKPQKKKKKSGISAYAILFTLLIAVLFGVKVYSNAQLNELIMEGSELKNEYAELQNEEKKLNIRLEQRMDLNDIETIAQTELGLMKIDKNQIQYITLPSEDKIECVEEESSGIFGETLRQFSILMEFLR